MLTASQLATVRAALRYWEEEMGPHDVEVMRPYLDPPDIEPLSRDELRQLRDRFDPQSIRYAVYDSDRESLAGTDLFVDCDEALQRAGTDDDAVTVLLPRSAL
jgi:hypothetical protein